MDETHQQLEEGKLKQEIKEGSSSISPASPPSSSSSPSHEFSFTISLHSSSNVIPEFKTRNPSSIAIDLSPADEIFFHGHLLPLHLLSHLPVSPRSSTNSLDGFGVPVREFFDDPNADKPSSQIDSNFRSSSGSNKSNNHGRKARNKSKPFNLFSLTRWGKGRVETEAKDKQKKKKRFDLSHVLKRYFKMVRPLLFFRRKSENLNLHRQAAYSFSGNLSLRNKKQGFRELSAPASMTTSPTNSGLLVTTTTGFDSSTSDSTVEELQAAIQAAIAHCKNSIGGEDKT